MRELADEVEKELPANGGEIPVANDKKDIHALVQQEVHPGRRRLRNLDDYYLKTRRGCGVKRKVPIALSLVYMEIVEMVGIDMIGVICRDIS